MTLEREANEVCDEIIRQVNDMIPCEWSEIHFLGEVDSDRKGWSVAFHFFDPEKNKYIYVHDIFKFYDDIEESTVDRLLREVSYCILDLFDIFVKYEQKVWDQIKITVNNECEFTVKYEYGKLDDEGYTQADRQMIWEYESFGAVPPNPIDKKMINKYLVEKNK